MHDDEVYDQGAGARRRKIQPAFDADRALDYIGQLFARINAIEQRFDSLADAVASAAIDARERTSPPARPRKPTVMSVAAK